MRDEWNDCLSAVVFILPPFLTVMIFVVAFSGIFVLLGLGKSTDGSATNPSFRDLLLISSAFGGFGYILGFFVGLSHEPLVTSVLGTVTAFGTTFLAMLYGKDAVPNAPRVVPCALLSMFLAIMITIEYSKVYITGASAH